MAVFKNFIITYRGNTELVMAIRVNQQFYCFIFFSTINKIRHFYVKPSVSRVMSQVALLYNERVNATHTYLIHLFSRFMFVLFVFIHRVFFCFLNKYITSYFLLLLRCCDYAHERAKNLLQLLYCSLKQNGGFVASLILSQ